MIICSKCKLCIKYCPRCATDINQPEPGDGIIYFEPETRQVSLCSECETREALIDPILESLGYMKGLNMREEHRVGPGAIVDYALFDASGDLCTIIEAKNVRVRLNKFIPQLNHYMRAASVNYGILTNGIDWEVYQIVDSRIIQVFKTGLDYPSLGKFMSGIRGF